MSDNPFKWPRGPRSSFVLDASSGVYALFLREGTDLPRTEPVPGGLIYVGQAKGAGGLKRRCHFHGKTKNHSPRKSLAVLLMDTLGLTPVLVKKPNAPDTWGLDLESDARLSAWMHANLELAVKVCQDVDRCETELVLQYAPPLNLNKCSQSAQHKSISERRGAVMRRVHAAPEDLPKAPSLQRATSHGTTMKIRRPAVMRDDRPPGGPSLRSIDTAERIAARFGLNPKSYRQKLRDTMTVSEAAGLDILG
jgi:hypothetical protein